MARARRHREEDAPKPRSDAYVGLLVISLIAMITGAVFLFLDWRQYPENKAPRVEEITKRPPPK